MRKIWIKLRSALRWLLHKLATTNWYYVITRLLVFIPVIICFCISANIEILVFGSVLSVLGFAGIAVFLALSLELFKLITPLLLVRRSGRGAAAHNSIVLALRLVLFFISFSCTFIAISDNLVDANLKEATAASSAVQRQVSEQFRQEYQLKQRDANALADQKVRDRIAAYDIDSKKAQLEALNQQYAAQESWATYSLILEMNQAITEAQAALNGELSAIEAERTRQLDALAAEYTPQRLQAQIEAALQAAGGTKYDQTQNTHITKAIYLIEATFGLQLSYEWVTVLVALLVCFASECIIWTGSVNLFTQLEKDHMPTPTSFQEEFVRRMLSGETGPDSLAGDVQPLPSIVVHDERLMNRLQKREYGQIKRRIDLLTREEGMEYRRARKLLRAAQQELNKAPRPGGEEALPPGETPEEPQTQGQENNM